MTIFLARLAFLLFFGCFIWWTKRFSSPVDDSSNAMIWRSFKSASFLLLLIYLPVSQWNKTLAVLKLYGIFQQLLHVPIAMQSYDLF